MNFFRIIRGRITKTTAGLRKLLRLDISGNADEELDDVELMQQYGVSSRPKAGAEVVTVQLGHRRIAISTAERNIIPDMAEGDVCIHTDVDQYVICKAAGGIDIRTGGAVTVYAATVRLGESDLPAPQLLPVQDGVVTPKCVCSFAGVHVAGSAKVLASA